MVKCEGDCDNFLATPFLAVGSNAHQPSNERIKEITNPELVNMLGNAEHSDLMESLETSRESDQIQLIPTRICDNSMNNKRNNSFEDTELLNFNQTSTISTQTPSGTYV